MQRFHYYPSASTALCGQPIGPGVIGTGDRQAFFQHYSSGVETHCHKCVRVMRRWADFRADLATADPVRRRNLGLVT